MKTLIWSFHLFILLVAMCSSASSQEPIRRELPQWPSAKAMRLAESAEVHQGAKEYEKAIQSLLAITELHPDIFDDARTGTPLHRRLAYAYRLAGKWNEALEHYEAILNEDDPMDRLNFARTLLSAGRSREAQVQFHILRSRQWFFQNGSPIIDSPIRNGGQGDSGHSG